MDVGEGMYEWSVRIIRSGACDLEFLPAQSPRSPLLRANRGEGWWWSESRKEEVRLKGPACALAAASADASTSLTTPVQRIVVRLNPCAIGYFMKVSSPQTLDSASLLTKMNEYPGVSSGTLRMLPYDRHGQPGTNLIGIEEPYSSRRLCLRLLSTCKKPLGVCNS